MNKSKFKSVKFKPFDMELDYQDSGVCECWTNQTAFGNSLGNDVFFTDSCIEAYPELFEVEKAEREFEEGAWYKLHSHKYKHGYTLGYYYELLNCFYVIGTNVPHYSKDFDKIGEKIEL